MRFEWRGKEEQLKCMYKQKTSHNKIFTHEIHRYDAVAAVAASVVVVDAGYIGLNTMDAICGNSSGYVSFATVADEQ